MHQPSGFHDDKKSDHVCMIHNSLYGSSMLYKPSILNFATFVQWIVFVQDNLLFVLTCGKDIAYLMFYVDDIALMASAPSLFEPLISSF